MKESKQTTPMTFAELVDKTVEYYSTNPRSLFDKLSCKYAGPNGERCAAARLCDESLSNFLEMDDLHDTSWGQVEYLAVLKPEYAHFNVMQISALQNLHDLHFHWLNPYGREGAEGLSEKGKRFVESIKSKYQNP